MVSVPYVPFFSKFLGRKAVFKIILNYFAESGKLCIFAADIKSDELMKKSTDKNVQVTVEQLSSEAVLSSGNGYTSFRYAGYNVRFKAPYSLERYISVKEWDDGYLVVMAKYKHSDEPEEEYIDLVPILEGLYIDKEEFLRPIKKVCVQYA